MKIKPGFLTSEFWVTLGQAISTLLIAFGVVNAEGAEAIHSAVVALGGFLISAYVVIQYIKSRTTIKTTK